MELHNSHFSCSIFQAMDLTTKKPLVLRLSNIVANTATYNYEANIIKEMFHVFFQQ